VVATNCNIKITSIAVFISGTLCDALPQYHEKLGISFNGRRRKKAITAQRTFS